MSDDVNEKMRQDFAAILPDPTKVPRVPADVWKDMKDFNNELGRIREEQTDA